MPEFRKNNESGERTALVVISYYAKRPIDRLKSLLKNLSTFEAGGLFKVCVVVNRVDHSEISLDFPELDLDILYRENIGMNIGAWDHGWRQNQDFDHVTFLQDDCYLVRDGWLSHITKRLDASNVGLLGESLNTDWQLDWASLREREKNVRLPEHGQAGQDNNRVNVYLEAFKAWNVQHGSSGLHLRALSWASTRDTLLAIDGFPIGTNYGECIAAEIAVSKKIEQIGLSIDTISSEPFHFFRHLEWNQAYAGGEFSQLGVRDREIKALTDKNKMFLEQLKYLEGLSHSSKWRQIADVLNGRFTNKLQRVLNDKCGNEIG